MHPRLLKQVPHSQGLTPQSSGVTQDQLGRRWQGAGWLLSVAEDAGCSLWVSWQKTYGTMVAVWRWNKHPQEE
jgi:hypothetical protein